VITATADIMFLGTDDGGLRATMASPCRALLFHTDAGQEVGHVALGVQVSTAEHQDLSPGTTIADARLDIWVDVAEIYLHVGQRFELGYPNRLVATAVVRSLQEADAE
jgi:hypothetical protein